MAELAAPVEAPRTVEERIDLWLTTPEIDLAFDPFRYREAQLDPHLPLYILDHDKFGVLSDPRPTILYAPEGGGKTSFRRRLTHACRSREEGRLVFPIALDYLRPNQDALQRLPGVAAQELLLHVLFWPAAFLRLSQAEQQEIVSYILNAVDDRHTLRFMLRQIEYKLDSPVEDVDWEEVARIFDAGASRFFIPPDLDQARAVVAQFRPPMSSEVQAKAANPDGMSVLSGWLSRLGYTAIYLMVDGVDAFHEAQLSEDVAIGLIEPFLNHLSAWTELAPVPLYLKLFLPTNLRRSLEQSGLLAPLTSSTLSDSIGWNREGLRELIRARLRAANRHVESLGALSEPDFRDADQALLKVLVEERRLLPRYLVALVEDLFTAHVTRVGPVGRLERQDLAVALEVRRNQPAYSMPGSL